MVTLTNRIEKIHQRGTHPKLSLVKTIYLDHQIEHQDWMMGISYHEALFFGLSSGVGGLYYSPTLDPTKGIDPLFVGWNSLDPLLDLAMSTGTWINRRFSENPEMAVEEIATYLAQWKKPVLVAYHEPILLKGQIDWFEEKRNQLPSISYGLVTEITNEMVKMFVHDSEEPICLSLEFFKQAITGLTNQWVDIIFPQQELDHTWSVSHALSRNVHHYQYGWRGLPSGLNGVKQFLRDTTLEKDSRKWHKTIEHALSMGGDFGRGWYATFLSHAAEQLGEVKLQNVAELYIQLSEAWVMYLYDLEKELVSKNMAKWIYQLEEQALLQLSQLTCFKEEQKVVS